jgi:hypothetical protein
MTQIVPTKSQNTGFAPDGRVLVRWLASEFYDCGFTCQDAYGKTNRLDQKKGG